MPETLESFPPVTPTIPDRWLVLMGIVELNNAWRAPGWLSLQYIKQTYHSILTGGRKNKQSKQTDNSQTFSVPSQINKLWTGNEMTIVLMEKGFCRWGVSHKANRCAMILFQHHQLYLGGGHLAPNLTVHTFPESPRQIVLLLSLSESERPTQCSFPTQTVMYG